MVVINAAERADELLGQLGYSSWRNGQKEAVVAALEGRDSLIVMPTGGGKSLCYQLPGIASADLTVVVSPLISLMTDQYRRLRQGGHPVAMIASGMDADAAGRALADVRSGQARIVLCSPERFGSAAFEHHVHFDAGRAGGDPGDGARSGRCLCECRCGLLVGQGQPVDRAGGDGNRALRGRDGAQNQLRLEHGFGGH